MNNINTQAIIYATKMRALHLVDVLEGYQTSDTHGKYLNYSAISRFLDKLTMAQGEHGDMSQEAGLVTEDLIRFCDRAEGWIYRQITPSIWRNKKHHITAKTGLPDVDKSIDD